jgi:hypothetical protein
MNGIGKHFLERAALTLAVLSTLSAPAQTSFEVASVMPSRPDQRSTAMTLDPSRLSVRVNSLKYLIKMGCATQE